MTQAFVDPRLELAVRAAMPQEVLAQPLGSLTQLAAPGLGIRRLGGIEQLSELRWLDLSRNPLTSVIELGSNTKLIRVLLEHTSLSTLDGLGGMPDLEDLDLYGSRVVDIADIAGLPALRSLDLGLCLVKDLGPLRSLTRLESLTIGNPTLHLARRSIFAAPDAVALDLAPIRQLHALSQLRLYGLIMPSLMGLQELVGLEELVLERCELSDRFARFPRLPRLEVLSLNNCRVPDLGALAELPRLRVLSLDDAKIRDLSPLLACERLEILSLRDTEIDAKAGVEQLRRLPRLAEIRVDNRVIRR
jgi:internalin A